MSNHAQTTVYWKKRALDGEAAIFAAIVVMLVMTALREFLP